MSDTAASTCLTLADFQPLPRPPFNASIRISQAVAWFDGRLYIGGGRGPLRDHRRAGSVSGAVPDAIAGAEEGAQIACYDPATGLWDLVYDSPLDGAGVARDRSVRALVVYQGPGDAAPALYAAVGSLQGQVVLLRSPDGRAFTPCGAPGLGQGDADIAAVRNLCVLENRLYTSPVGMNNARGWADDNVAEMPLVLRCADPATGAWEIVSDPCFGDAANESINEMIVFNDTLYVATLNRLDGFQLWRATGLGGDADPVWVKVLDRGACRGPANPVPAAMQVFDGALYIGTGVQRQPGAAADRFGPIAPELIRVWPDDSWDLIAGEARCTPQGLKMPLSGQGPGFDDPFVQAFWRIGVHEGVLYVGGSDWRFWPTYLPRGRRQRTDILPETESWLRQQTAAWQGDYGLWCSADGNRWQTVTTTGLGDSRAQYGIREILSTPIGLVVVPAAKTGAAAGADTADGGIEIWLGAAT